MLQQRCMEGSTMLEPKPQRLQLASCRFELATHKCANLLKRVIMMANERSKICRNIYSCGTVVFKAMALSGKNSPASKNNSDENKSNSSESRINSDTDEA
ncbi:hypothetical protein DSO57_1039782 [Entomophthora muscae]|uniref:Uncharacterized protein n=1 Tax=Entomophthora muscae TaxID=34485 RepID=A0ACC2RKH1_9FUNG|nr:hypothetical protein DSO57_1039782 [Entomophthora muscae]